jgi:CelD/BcsL family acetyltransferase involved in cellulose biosynthesis
MKSTVRLLPAREMSAVAPIWSALETRVGAGRLMISWTWTSTWLRYFGECVDFRFALTERGGDPVGVVLLVRSHRGPRAFPLRRLHLGTAGEPPGETAFVEYNDLLCGEADRDDVAGALVGAVRALPGWDELDVQGFQPRTAKALQRHLPLKVREDPSWTIRLDPAKPVMATFSSATRRLVRQARDTLVPGQPERAMNADAARDMLGELAALHQRRWQAVGRPGVFASPRLSGFLRDLTQLWLPSGQAELYRLPGREGTIGCILGFIENSKFLYYQSGVQQFDDTRKRGGLLCHAAVAEECRLRGLTEYELLAGDDQYKRQLSRGEHNSLAWGYYGRPSLRGRLITLARASRAALAARRAREAAIAARETRR